MSRFYNDVVVYDGQGNLQIYGYPTTVFPPTDFHTATWVAGWIYIIGNLGYLGDRTIGETPVYRLNCSTFAIEKVTTCGEAPGWIHKHRAVLSHGQIHISGGKIWAIQQDKPTLVDHTEAYFLDLEQHCWHRVEYKSIFSDPHAKSFHLTKYESFLEVPRHLKAGVIH
ncbi:hypothetical protein [Leptolyngbya sp. GGD]|uniref:hypothetical protein n=1 Tax=Leptolyngbya sp. GGD TaxID=2997907 RepID=UPI00227B41BC|nr:hypothetical protein [Leptolyngbya sp. GGD]MCY6492760.1 hypothetical protein [Leptolyngbya sp. GGD]